MRQASFEEKMKAVEQDAYDARMAAMTLPTRGTCIVDDETAVMDREYFEALGEYSMSMPTGVFIGKRWKRDLNGNAPHWKCSKCGALFTGWTTEGHPCNKQGCGVAVGGVLHFFEMPPHWVMAEYVKTDDPSMAGTKWREIIVL
jgi:hypothetical protein